MNALLKKENRAVKETPVRSGFITPHVDVFETREGYVLEAELPGVSKNGLEVTLEGNELTIIGRRQVAELNGDLLYRESSNRDFRRVFELDPTIDTAKIDARIENGVLFLQLPKAEQVRSKKISVSD